MELLVAEEASRLYWEVFPEDTAGQQSGAKDDAESLKNNKNQMKEEVNNQQQEEEDQLDSPPLSKDELESLIRRFA